MSSAAVGPGDDGYDVSFFNRLSADEASGLLRTAAGCSAAAASPLTRWPMQRP